jgi:exodeoxyribonuclease VII small subunit
MTDETYTFEQTRVRLEGILVEVRKKDTSLEQSLELLEEGVRLLNQCNELIDQTAWRPASAESPDGGLDGPSVSATALEVGSGPTGTADEAGAPADAPQAAEAADGSGGADEAEEIPDDERD